MSLPSAAEPTHGEGSRLPAPQGPGPSLPPVEAPTGTFVLQLFLIPLLIVTIVVVLWLLFNWMAAVGRDDPAELAKSIQWGNESSWQRSYELADLLRSPDPKYDALRRDEKVAASLADFLNRDLNEPVQGTTNEIKQRVMRRMYLCRALGSFHVPTALDVLLRAATQEGKPEEVEVRYSALEGIATLADNCGPEMLAEDEPRRQQVLEVLLAASEAQDASSGPPPPADKEGKRTLYRPHAELRAVAAYALGVIGGERAEKRLQAMLHDSYPNARYNAATGLARAGDPQCERVLKEMLDPENEVALRDERYADDQARKRTTVLLNGIKGTLLYAERNPGGDLSRLKQSLTAIANSPLTNVQIDRNKIKRAASEALERLPK